MWHLYVKYVRDPQWKFYTSGSNMDQLDAQGQDLLEKEVCVNYSVREDETEFFPCYLNQPGP